MRERGSTWMEEESEDKSLSLARISVRTGAHKFLFAYKCEKLLFSRGGEIKCADEEEKKWKKLYISMFPRGEKQEEECKGVYISVY